MVSWWKERNTFPKAIQLFRRAQARCDIPVESFSPTGQVDLDLLRGQQLKLYILKAGRALLSHQDQLRQILSQPAVQEVTAAHSGIF